MNKRVFITVCITVLLLVIAVCCFCALWPPTEHNNRTMSTEDVKTGKEIERDYLFKEEEVFEIPTEYEEDTLMQFIANEDGQQPFETEVVKLTDDTSGLESSVFSWYADSDNPDFITLMQYVLKYYGDKEMELGSVTQCEARVNNCTISSDGTVIRFVTGKPKDVPDDSIKIYLYVEEY